MIKTFSKPTKVVKESPKVLKESYAEMIEKLYNKNPTMAEVILTDFITDVGKDFADIDFDPKMSVTEVLTAFQLSPLELRKLYTILAGTLTEGTTTKLKEGYGDDEEFEEYYEEEDDSESGVLSKIIGILADEYDEVLTFEEAGLLTKNKGFVIKVGNKSFQFSLPGS